MEIKMNPQEQRYREEFEKYDDSTNILNMDDYDIRETYYLTGRKAGEELVEFLRKELSEKSVAIVNMQEEISQLKAENERLKGINDEYVELRSGIRRDVYNENQKLKDLVAELSKELNLEHSPVENHKNILQRVNEELK